MTVGILYERSGTDEMGIRLTAEELGIALVFIPFRKVAVRIGETGISLSGRKQNHSPKIQEVGVVLNRAQSKNRRLVAAEVMETLDKYCVNSSSVEYICHSKLRTILRFWKRGIRVPTTVFVPCDTHEVTLNGQEINNDLEIAELIQQELGENDIVFKPDAGTHGKEVRFARNRKDLLEILREIEPSIINPTGVIAQEFIDKWFYDLRILVMKEKGRAAYCFPTALARAGFKDFRTNTFLGNMVFGVNLPSTIMELSERCGYAIGEDSETWVLALDAMIDVGEDRICDDEYVKKEFERLEQPFETVKKVKADKTKKREFARWNKKLEQAFQDYKEHEAYERIKGVIEESMERNKSKILFHEANACPEFWEQTRCVAGINVAVPLLECAQSVDDDHGGN